MASANDLRQTILNTQAQLSRRDLLANAGRPLGAAALASLMADATGATQRALVAAGGLPVLVGAMRTHAALPAVQDWACVALFYLTNGGADCVAAAQAAGAKACLLSAFHARNPGEWKKRSCPGIGHAISYLGMWASPGLAARWKLTELGEAKVATVDVAGVRLVELHEHTLE